MKDAYQAPYTVGTIPTELGQDGQELNLPLEVWIFLDTYSEVYRVHSQTHHPHKLKRKRGVLVSPHHNDGTFTVGQPSLNSTLSQLRGDKLPQLTVKT